MTSNLKKLTLTSAMPFKETKVEAKFPIFGGRVISLSETYRL